jgi:hypothetical protein
VTCSAPHCASSLTKSSERPAHPQFSSLQNVPSSHLHELPAKTKSSTINTHVPSTIFLRNQNNRNGARTKAFSYILVVQKLLGMSLNFLCLFWISPICCAIWQRHSRDQVNLMYNSSQRWLSWGHLGRENIFKFLQKDSDSTRQRCSNIVKQKKTCLHTKA